MILKKNNYKQLFCVLAIMMFGVSSAYAWEVVLKPEVSLDHAQVRLGDIAEINPCGQLNTEEVNSLANAVISKAPQPGRSRNLMRSLIIMRLKNSGQSLANMTLNGAGAVSVKRNSQLITENEIMEGMKQWLSETNHKNRADFILELKSPLRDIEVPAGEKKLIYDIDVSGMSQGRLRVETTIVINGEAFTDILSWIYVREKHRVLYARHALERKQIVGRADLYFQETFVMPGEEYCPVIEDVVGKVVKVRIAKDAMMRNTWVERQPLVKRGSKVTGLIRNKSMTISLALNAMEDGFEDEVIKLYNAEAHKHLTGRVVGPQTVEVLI